MLFLTFKIGDDLYALDCGHVIEIIPLVGLREFSKSPPYVRGVFKYRRKVAPVVDLCGLLGCGAARRLFSTRIIVVGVRDGAGIDRVLGLVAEQVMETIRVEEPCLVPTGIVHEGSPYLGKMIKCSHGLIQCISPGSLLTGPLGSTLFPTEE